MRYFRVKELVDKGVVRLVHEGTDSMVADILTKPLGPEKFKVHANRLLQGLVYPKGGSELDIQEESKSDDSSDEADDQEL
jgi:hypothetical protein